MTPTQQKRRAAYARLVRSLDVPKRDSIKTPTMSDADKTRKLKKAAI